MIFQVAGHTDDVSTPLYDRQLSQRRAEAAVNHLVAFYGIARERLKPMAMARLASQCLATRRMQPIAR